MQQRAWMLVVAVVGIGFVAACDDDEPTAPNNIKYHANLNAASEVTSTGASANVVSTATGTWDGTLDTKTNILTYTLTFSGLTSNSRFAHIHAPAAATTTAGVLVDFTSATYGTMVTGATSGTATGSINMSGQISTTISGDSLRKLLDAGMAYANVHSLNYGGGEIRGQIAKQ
jgi:hypothetical protein